MILDRKKRENYLRRYTWQLSKFSSSLRYQRKHTKDGRGLNSKCGPELKGNCQKSSPQNDVTLVKNFKGNKKDFKIKFIAM